MKTNATSGSIFSLSIVLILVILVFISDKAYATPLGGRSTGRRSIDDYKDNCMSFGHTCFGAHGKRFDSTVQRNTLQESISQNFQESEIPSSNDELFYVLPNDEFREQSDQSFMRTSKDSQQFNVYPLSSLVDQWIALHRRPHRTNTDITNK
ncbi:uncharacterized protein LOC105208172 [Solenopsis invicta]|uniref:uncharacterized protein LOC105208172 n=1 Tax=Solenopsis invicta TaxID=13686 RepID=UPI0005961103|nr:uncharacterized protein LOC105208172 [Solenopsis invicta]